jgi:hypothetical protein
MIFAADTDLRSALHFSATAVPPYRCRGDASKSLRDNAVLRDRPIGQTTTTRRRAAGHEKMSERKREEKSSLHCAKAPKIR